MTLLLAHPAAEDLGRFVEGTLPDNERGEVVAHIADCDECRILVVDSAEFIEPAKKESPRWWAAVAAAVVLSVGIGSFVYWHFNDRLADVKGAYGQLKVRPFEARLSGFPYVPWHVNRGGGDEAEPEPTVDIMKGEAAGVTELRGDDAKTLDARGVGFLLTGSAGEAVAQLQDAVNREPNNVHYQSDLAAALLATARGKSDMERALAACDQALRIDPRSADALFNRAVALEQLDRRSEAITAYDRYLAVDAKSSWADEAKINRERDAELLRPLP